MNDKTEQPLTYDHIVALALEHGFKLKPQVDGRMALNDYVIDFARAVYDIGHAAAIDTLRAQLAEAQRDADRLDWIIEHRAYVVSDPDCCDGYWLNYARPDGTMWTQATEHETPRAAIDAARGEKNGA